MESELHFWCIEAQLIQYLVVIYKLDMTDNLVWDYWDLNHMEEFCREKGLELGDCIRYIYRDGDDYEFPFVFCVDFDGG